MQLWDQSREKKITKRTIKIFEAVSKPNISEEKEKPALNSERRVWLSAIYWRHEKKSKYLT